VAWFDDQMDADAIVVGAGLAGLTATAELARAGRRVLLLDQEPEANLGGQAFWSFGGLFLVGSPEQRRMGIRDSRELAWQDWMGSAFFDRGADDPAGEDYWAYRWAQAYVDFAAGEKRSWLHGMGVRWLPLVGWAERGVTWPTGTATRCPASTSRGAPARPWWLRSSGRSRRRRVRAWSGCGSGTEWTGSL
jgi:predicted oxidoreductase